MYALKRDGLEPKVLDRPEPGFYELEWSHRGFTQRNKSYYPVCIWLGPPLDPVTGDEMDRGPKLQCRVNGVDADPYEYWPMVCARPISQEQYISMLKEMLDE